ncbi:MAG: hypothetical protein HRU05_12450 [Oceanospirillaceae bacterium]|nr:hypothetical protein [Oceanospirillaceae bacterium]
MITVAKFTRMINDDKQDYQFLEHLEREYASGVGERLIQALLALDDSLSGYQVTRLEHRLPIPHERTAFNSQQEVRHMQGCYIDRNGPENSYRVANRQSTGTAIS